MYSPAPLSTPPGIVAMELAHKALERRLTIYAGAGLSAASPTELPGAARLAKRVADALGDVVNLNEVDPWDLLAVADAIAAQPRGPHVLRETILRVADLLEAPFNYGHRVVALLICEGAVTALETNYDDCIERAAQPERLPVVRTSDELLHGPATALLKAHGCATLPPTMLVTTDDLKRVAFWADATVSAKLTQDHVAFIGIGSVADYVRSSIAAVLATTGEDHITLIDPALARWDDDPDLGWRALLPDLPADQRIAEDASSFCDALLRAYLKPFRDRIKSLTSGFPSEHGQRIGTDVVIAALETMDAAHVLRWLRDASWRLAPGHTALTQVTASLLIAAGSLVCDTWGACLWPSGMMVATPATGEPGSEVVLVILGVQDTKSGAAAAKEARRRVVEARSHQLVGDSAAVVVLVAGHIGDLGLDEVAASRGCSLQEVMAMAASVAASTPGDLVAEPLADHLIDGPQAGQMVLVSAMNIGEVLEAV